MQRTQSTASGRYETLKTQRDPYLRRAEINAKLTIPSLFLPEGSSGGRDLYQTFQSVGARGVNHLSAKLLLALFPPNQPFFRLALDEFVLEELQEKSGLEYADAKADFDQALSRVEQAVMARMDQRQARATLSETLKHLVVTGNGLLQVLPDAGLRFHPLSNYVLKRDKTGSVLEIVVLEKVSRDSLPEAALELLNDAEQDGRQAEDGENNIDLYTRIYREKRKWRVYQEVNGRVVPGTEGTYPLDKTPWLPLRLIKVDGEDYGRAFIEEYIGDLRTLESLTQSIVEFAAVASKILIFVDEGGVTRRKDVAEAPSGAVVRGRAQDVSAFQLDKFPDFRVTWETARETKNRLEQAFLLFSGVQRDAERVTAAEIRAVIHELEQGLGGIYSVLSQELQAPLVRRIIHQMQRAGDLPQLPDDAVAPQIITGVDALGRASDLQRLDLFVAGVSELFGPQAVAEYINVGSYMKRRGAALGLDLEGMVRSEEEVQRLREQRVQEAIAQQIGPEAAKAALNNPPEGG